MVSKWYQLQTKFQSSLQSNFDKMIYFYCVTIPDKKIDEPEFELLPKTNRIIKALVVHQFHLQLRFFQKAHLDVSMSCSKMYLLKESLFDYLSKYS